MVQCANLWQQGRTAWQNPMNRPPLWPSHQAYSNPASSCFRRRRHLKLLPAGSKRHPLSRLTWQSWSIWSLARKMLCRNQKLQSFPNLQRDCMIKIKMIASDTTTNKPTRCSTTCCRPPPTQEKTTIVLHSERTVNLAPVSAPSSQHNPPVQMHAPAQKCLQHRV